MIIVDTSVAPQWVLPEQNTEQAVALLEGEEELASADVLLVEVGIVLAKKARHGEIGREQAVLALRFIADRVRPLFPSAPVLDTALELSMDLSHPLYDCIFLAVAERHQAVVVTRDAPFANRAAGRGHSAHVRLLRQP